MTSTAPTSIKPLDLRSGLRGAALGLALSAGLLALAPQPAQALTLIIDFTTSPVVETWNDPDGSHLKAADFSLWGFSLSTAEIQSQVLAAVTNDYLGFPTFASNALSPLPAGKRLNLSIELSTGLTTPANGDSEYYYFAVGDNNGGTEDELGHACYGCVRSANLGPATPANGAVVGVNFTDNLRGLDDPGLNDTQRINILAGTISHELGHTMLLDHPVAPPYTGQLTNPGTESIYSIMGTGADPTNMPNEARYTDRAFSYAEYSTLINTVGVTDVSPVPEPAAMLMMLAGMAALVGVRRQRGAAA